MENTMTSFGHFLLVKGHIDTKGYEIKPSIKHRLPHPSFGRSNKNIMKAKSNQIESFDTDAEAALVLGKLRNDNKAAEQYARYFYPGNLFDTKPLIPEIS